MNSDRGWSDTKSSAPQGDDEVVSWSVPPTIDRSKVYKLSIIGNLFMGRNLISADEDGLCDPTLVFDHLGSKARSSTYFKSLNPVWNERVVINSYLYDTWLPPIIVDCLDRDEHLIASDTFENLGLAIVKLNKKNILRTGDPNLIPKPEWYLVRDESNMTTASLLLSFSMLLTENPVDVRSLYPLTQQREQYLIKLYILGLRDMQSSGLFEVKHPFIKLHIGALKSSEKSKGGNAFDIMTSKCKKGGPNASFSDVLT